MGRVFDELASRWYGSASTLSFPNTVKDLTNKQLGNLQWGAGPAGLLPAGYLGVGASPLVDVVDRSSDCGWRRAAYAPSAGT
jgi:hypothetical protein